MRLNTSSGVSTPYLDCPRWLPFGLLQHTGIDSLLLIVSTELLSYWFNLLIPRNRQSLKTCLAFLQHYETPDPTHASLPTCVRLIELTTAASGTAARCNRLCGLSGGDIIGNIWIYASRNPDALRVSVDVIPNIAKVLGVGVSRYPKVSMQVFS